MSSRDLAVTLVGRPKVLEIATPVVRPLVSSNTSTKLFGLRVSSGAEASWPKAVRRKPSDPLILPLALSCADPMTNGNESWAWVLVTSIAPAASVGDNEVVVADYCAAQ